MMDKDEESKQRLRQEQVQQARNNDASKDLIDIISDQSAEDSSFGACTRKLNGTSAANLPQATPDNRHGSSMTFFNKDSQKIQIVK